MLDKQNSERLVFVVVFMLLAALACRPSVQIGTGETDSTPTVTTAFEDSSGDSAENADSTGGSAETEDDAGDTDDDESVVEDDGDTSSTDGSDDDTMGGDEVCSWGAAFVSDVTVPDGTEIEAGRAFTKTWRIRNAGCQDWPEGTRLSFGSGDRMGGPDDVAVSPTSAGETVDISVNLTAPAAAGEYIGYWVLNPPDVEFDYQIYVEIVVPGEASSGEDGDEGQPDLVIAGALIDPDPPVDEEPFTITLIVENRGDAPSGATEIGSTFIEVGAGATQPVGPLDPGALSYHEFGYTADEGTYTIDAIIDSGDTVNESNEGNNTFNQEFDVTAGDTLETAVGRVPDMSGNVSTGGCSDTLRAGVAPALNPIRAVISFDISSLTPATAADFEFRLELRVDSLDGDPFDHLGRARVDQVTFGNPCSPAAFDSPAIVDLGGFTTNVYRVDVTEQVQAAVDNGDEYFQIRVYFENDEAAEAGDASMMYLGAPALVGSMDS